MKTKTNKPDLYSYIARNIVAPLWALKERSPYLRHYRTLKGSPYRSDEQIREDQNERLIRLVKHAYENTTFYRQRFNDTGMEPGDIRDLSDLNRLPLLTKEDIRSHKDAMVAGTVPKDKLVPRKTSGSTGVSLEFFVDEDSLQWKRGCTLRTDRWTGWDLGEKIGAVWGNPEYKKSWRGYVRNYLLERITYLDTLKMDRDAMLGFYRQVKRRKPTLLFGHAHSLYLFAHFLEKEGLTDLRPRGIISTAMVLHDFERRKVEDVFGCAVTNRYGCEEVSLIACECEEHEGLHINMDSVIVEFLKDGYPVAPGEPGSIVVTDLTNYGMPFIRYQVGDVATQAGKKCSCGRSYPLIESIEGRIADYVLTPGGDYISGISLTENFAMYLPDVKQLQIIQEKIDELRLLVVKGETFTAGTTDDIADLVRERFGTDMRHSVEYVDNIPQESSGKFRFCISKLGNNTTIF